MNYPTGAEALLIAIQTPSPNGSMGIPVLLWGKPGIGKSSFLESLRSEAFPVMTLIAAIHDPTDFSGLPIHDKGQVKYAVPEWVNQFSDGEGLLFLDELTTAPPAVQAALLRVVLERNVGFHKLPDGVRVVAAANPPDMIIGGWELSPPLRNRFVHLNWDLPAQTYIEALESGFEKAALPNVDKDEHNKRLPAWKLKIAAFLKRNPTLLSTSPEEDEYGFASPRTWDFVAALMTSCEVLGIAPTYGQKPSKTVIDLIKGCIGASAALPFFSFLKELNLPDPEKVLDGEENLALNKLNDSEIYIFFATLGDTLLERGQADNFVDSTYRFFNIIDSIFEIGKRDLIYPSLRKIVRTNIEETAFLQHLVFKAGESEDGGEKMMTHIQNLFSDEVFSKYIEILN